MKVMEEHIDDTSLSVDQIAEELSISRNVLYRKTKNLRAVQLLLGHSNLDSTVRYLGIDVDDALTIAEQIEV